MTPPGPFEEALAAVVGARIDPLATELHRLIVEVGEIRQLLPSPLVSVEEAAQRIGVSPSTARRQIKAGNWPTRRIGRRVVVDLQRLRGMTGDDIAAAARDARRAP